MNCFLKTDISAYTNQVPTSTLTQPLWRPSLAPSPADCTYPPYPMCSEDSEDGVAEQGSLNPYPNPGVLLVGSNCCCMAFPLAAMQQAAQP